LKKELDGASKGCLPGLEEFGGPKQHGSVRIMPAGVHLAVVAAPKFHIDLRAERVEGGVCFFKNGKSVHVGSQCNARLVACSDLSDDAGHADGVVEGDAQAVEDFLDFEGRMGDVWTMTYAVVLLRL
jgi:hypothetical protein